MHLLTSISTVVWEQWHCGLTSLSSTQWWMIGQRAEPFEPQEVGRKPELSLCGHSQHTMLLMCAQKKHHSIVASFSSAISHIDWFQRNVLHCFSQCSCTAWSFPSPVNSGSNVKNVRTENSQPLHLTLHDHLIPSFILGIFDNVC